MIQKWHLIYLAPFPSCSNVDHVLHFLAFVGVFHHVYYAILAKYKSWTISISWQFDLKNIAGLLVMLVRWSLRVPLEIVFVDICTSAHRVMIWLLAECFMMFCLADVCLLLNGLEEISQIIRQLSWTREICWFKSYLEAIDFPHSHKWRHFWRIANFCLEIFSDDVV